MPLPLYFNRAFSIVELTDYVPATVKTMVFGFIIATIVVVSRVHDRVGHRRRRPRVHARVVLSSMLIIVANVVLVRLIFFIFPKAAGG